LRLALNAVMARQHGSTTHKASPGPGTGVD